MFAIEAPLTGGIGKVVPGGAPEMTGVLELAVSVALQPASKQHNASMSQRELLVIVIMLDFFPGERFTGDTILTFNPLAEIDKLTALSTEGTKGVIFPLDWLTAGWAFHESLKPRNGPQRIKETRVA